MNNETKVLTELIRSRRSIFPASYTDKAVPREAIELMLANANYAPTHKLTQPWRFCVYRGKGLEKLADAIASEYKRTTDPASFQQQKFDSMRTKILKSSCVIALVMQRHEEKLPEWEEFASVACAVQNMWLTASSMGIGSYWSTPGVINSLGPFLGLQEHQKCIGLFYMGYHDEEPRPANRTPIEEKVTWREE